MWGRSSTFQRGNLGTMRIGYDAKRAFHNVRGLGSFSRTLLSDLGDLYPDDELLLFTPAPKIKLLEWFSTKENLKLVTPGALGSLFSSLWRSFFLTTIITDYDLDIFHGLSHELPPGIEKSGVKSVVTMHDLIYVKFPHFFNGVDRRIFEKKFAHAVRNADIVVAICEQTKKDLMEHFVCPASKIRVVYQSCHPQFYQNPEYQINEIKSKYGLPEKYFFYLGAIVENKNIKSLIDAYASGEMGEHHLVIGGRPSDYQKDLVSQVKQLGLEEKIHFILNPKDNELPTLYHMADCFCFPSFYEGFGIPVIESLFSGTPVITSIQGALREAAGEGALYIDPFSIDSIKGAMERIIAEPELKKALSSMGLSHVQKFKSEVVTREMHKVYEELTLQ